MTDREERQSVIEVLEHMLEWMKAANTVLSKPERIKALDYAINSIKTDLKYDLLYEKTTHIADADKKIEPITKNDLGVERQIKEICISYSKSDLKEHDGQPYYSVKYIENGEEYEGYGTYKIEVFMEYLRNYFMPSVTPQEPQSFKWCDTCKEYDQEKHCCHRYSKVIRDTVAEIEQEPTTKIRPKGHWIGHREHCENLGVMPSGLGVYEWCSNCDCGIDVREWYRNHYNYCPNCGADMRG